MIRLALAGTGADGGTRRAFSLAQTFGLFSSPDVHVWGSPINPTVSPGDDASLGPFRP